MKTDADLEQECREKFAYYCKRYAESPFHIDKKRYVEKAYEQVEIFLDLRAIDGL